MSTSRKTSMNAKAKFTAAQFDRAFERGEGFEMLDLKSVKVHAPMQRINLDLPQPMLRQIDHEADRIGVPRTSVIKLWLAEKLSEIHTPS